MKNIFSKFMVFLLVICFTACQEDYLDTVPTASVDAGSAYKTTANSKASINGIYRAMVVRYGGSQGHFGYPAVMIIMDHMGEDLMHGATSASWHVGETRYTAHRTDNNVLPTTTWTMFYRLIGNANAALANVDTGNGTAAEKSALKAEALGIRAFAYLNLVQLYGKRFAAGTPNAQLGVPLVLTPTIEGQARNTVAEVYAQINKDLEEAAKSLPAARSFKSHINLDVVKGLQARSALLQEKFAVAATIAADAKKNFPLMTTARYEEGFSDISNPEWMWGFDHLEDQSEFFGAYHSYISCNYNSTVIRTYPKVISKALYDSLSQTDVRAKMWVKAPTATNSIVPPGGIRPAYLNQKFKLPGTPSTSAQGDIPYMRSAEMWLIEAEALARSGKDADAAKVLFDLIKTRDTGYKQSTKTGAALLNEIMFHRRVELWGEGHRFLDLKRLNQPLNRNNSNHIAAITTLFDLAAGDKLWEFLIPRAEMDANKNMVQNPL
jgi:starch-binding outer membrane protein, SusD/RagB family